MKKIFGILVFVLLLVSCNRMSKDDFKEVAYGIVEYRYKPIPLEGKDIPEFNMFSNNPKVKEIILKNKDKEITKEQKSILLEKVKQFVPHYQITDIHENPCYPGFVDIFIERIRIQQNLKIMRAETFGDLLK